MSDEKKPETEKKPRGRRRPRTPDVTGRHVFPAGWDTLRKDKS